MKTFLHSLKVLLVLAAICGCTINTVIPGEEQIKKRFRDQPFDTIRSNVAGKWQLSYLYNGFVGEYTYPVNTFIEFKIAGNYVQDSILWYDDTAVYVNNRLYWLWGKALYGDSTYVMKIIGDPHLLADRLIPFDISPTRDSLLLKDDFNDGSDYLLTKVE